MMKVDNRNAETMDYVAELTGGKAFHNTNDLAGAVRKAIDDSSVSYTLGYYATGEERDKQVSLLEGESESLLDRCQNEEGLLGGGKPTSH